MVRKVAAFAALFVVGCGGSTPEPKVEETTHEPTSTRPTKSLPAVQQELGSIDQRGVEQTFFKLQDKTEVCHQKGRDRIEYLTGDVKVFLRIDANGKVRYGYFEESSLGDRESEKCILDVFRAAQWPKPEGGEAEVRNGFGWGPGGEREPASWGPEKVMNAISESKGARKDVEKCKAGVKGDLRITGYVVSDETAADEADEASKSAKPAGKNAGKPAGKNSGGKHDKHGGGRFQSIGISATTKEAAEKADCVVDALKDLRLPSPGSYAVKVSYTL